jgi:hypothetical protein
MRDEDDADSDNDEWVEERVGNVEVREREVQVETENHTGEFRMMNKGVSVLGRKTFRGS